MFVSTTRIFSSTADHCPKMKLSKGESRRLILEPKVLANPARLSENDGVAGVTF